MKIVFLDVDGVLDSLQYWQGVEAYGEAPLDPDAVKRLARLVEQAGGRNAVALVLTSSWRVGWERDAALCGNEGTLLNEALAEEGLFVFDRTTVESVGGRPQEIKKWLREYPGKVESFVILDDANFLWDEEGLTPYWVQTDFQFGGLKDEHIAQALAILQKQPLRLKLRNLRKE